MEIFLIVMPHMIMNTAIPMYVEGQSTLQTPSLAGLLRSKYCPDVTTPFCSCLQMCKAIRSGQYPFVMCNFAPPDMVGHTGKYEPAIKGCEATGK